MQKQIKLKCKTCNKEFLKDFRIYTNDRNRGIGAGKFCSKKCFYKSPERSPNTGNKAEKSYGWKGGRIMERGYVMVKSFDHPDGVLKGGGERYIREHRLLVENLLGRRLTKEEAVHHINGNRSDNRIENLKLMTKSEHNSLHMTETMAKRFPKCKGAACSSQADGNTKKQ